jgi:hypothetical protein
MYNLEEIDNLQELSAPDLIMILGEELAIYPALLMEQIGEEEEAKAIVRDYLKGLATYEQVREKVSEIV